MKGSRCCYQHDSDTENPLKFEMNFTYLFGINSTDLDGCIELDTAKSIFIQNSSDIIYQKQFTEEELKETYGIDILLTRE